MNAFRKITAAGAMAAVGALAVPVTVPAATPDTSVAPSAVAAIESNPLLHSPPENLISKIPAESRYTPWPRATIHFIPLAPKDTLVPGHRETERLQRALNHHGADLAVNGVMTQRTMTALLNYQSDHGVAATGRLDGVTKTLLNIG